MNKITLSEKQRKNLETSAKKILGQLNNVIAQIQNDKISEATFIQMLAIKGGSTRICKDIISQGVIPNMDKYSPKAIDRALDLIFKL